MVSVSILAGQKKRYFNELWTLAIPFFFNQEAQL